MCGELMSWSLWVWMGLRYGMWPTLWACDQQSIGAERAGWCSLGGDSMKFKLWMSVHAQLYAYDAVCAYA